MDLKELIRRAQEAELEATRKKGLEPDEALELVRVLETIAKIDLDKPVEPKTAMDRLIADLKANKDAKRALKRRCKEVRKKLHWTQKKSRRKRYEATRYREVLKPRRRAEKAELLQTAEGWWKYQKGIWDQNGVEVLMTEEEFTEVVYPAFKGRVPILERYDKTKGMSLDNLLVRDSDTRKVIWDGKEYKLRMLGLIL